MKLAHALGLAILVAPLVAAGQISYGTAGMEGVGPKSESKPLTASRPASCPVALQARHVPDGSMIQTGKQHPKGRGQALHLTFTSPDARNLASATIDVHGWTAAGRLQPTSHRDSRAVRTLQVPLTAGNGRTASADLWVPGMTAIESIDLVSASYSDGSSWTPAAGTRCRVTPDLLMLISQP